MRVKSARQSAPGALGVSAAQAIADRAEVMAQEAERCAQESGLESDAVTAQEARAAADLARKIARSREFSEGVTVKRVRAAQLVKLVREAMYDGPGTASVKTLRDFGVADTVANRRQSQIAKLRLRIIDEHFATLLVYLTQNAGKSWTGQSRRSSDDPSSADVRHEYIFSKQEFRDVLRSLGFAERAIADVEFDYHAGDRGGMISMDAGVKFIAEWRRLYGAEKTVDLT